MLRFKSLKTTSDAMLHLDALRFIASAGIVVTHSEEFFFPLAIRRAQTNIGLALFVDMFFLISGFVMAYVYGSKVATGTQITTFFWRRFARLIPLHVLTFLISIAIWTTVEHHSHGLALPNTAPSNDPVCLADTLFLLHGIIPCGKGYYHNGVTWSISVEMLMYALFPLICRLAARRPWLTLGAGSALMLADFAYVISQGGLYADWEMFKPMRCLPSFLLGMAMFRHRDVLARLRLPHWVLSGLTLVLVATMVTNVPNVVRIVLIVAVVALAVGADTVGQIPTYVRRLAPLGQLTYSLYLWHGLVVLVLLNGIADKYLHLSGLPMLGFGLLTYASLGVISYLSYQWFEDPVRIYIDGLRRRMLARSSG